MEIQISKSDLEYILRVIQTHLPECTAIAFGSRVSGKPRKYSDFDLAIDASRPLTLKEKRTLENTYAASNLPFRVDIVDLNCLEPDFEALIRKGGIILSSGSKPPSQLTK